MLLAQNNTVSAVDIMSDKVKKINRKISPIQDEYIEKYLAEKERDLSATLDGEKAYGEADFVSLQHRQIMIRKRTSSIALRWNR